MATFPVSTGTGAGGLPTVSICTGAAEADIYLHGANLTHWQPKGAQPVLFLSGKSEFVDGKPIRGGVPICFPWFGPKAGDTGHGFVRDRAWVLEDTRIDDVGVVNVVLSTESTPETLKRWPHPYRARMIYSIGATLEMTFEVENTGDATCVYSEALHPYFVVGDIHRVKVLGLDGADYRDYPDRKQITRQNGEIAFTCETDRVFVNTKSTCVIEDPSMKRRVVIAKSGSDSTTVWNPWISKSAALADFGDDEWKTMVCVETMNAFENSVILEAGATHRMTATVSVEAT